MKHRLVAIYKINWRSWYIGCSCGFETKGWTQWEVQSKFYQHKKHPT